MIDKMSSKKCNVRINYDNFTIHYKSEIFGWITSTVGKELIGKHKVRCFLVDKINNKLELYNTNPELEDNWEELITEFFDSITTIDITTTTIERKSIIKYKEVKKTYTCKISYIIDFKGGNIYNIYNKESVIDC